MSGLVLNVCRRMARSMMFAAMFVMFLPFGVLVGVGKAIKLLLPVKDVI